jgi:predicted DNA-binding transcriptional regulator YafY
MMDISGIGYDSSANDRLETIVAFFWKGGRATAGELAERFGVTRRTINNDLSKLHILEKEGWTYYLPTSYLQLQPYEKAAMSGAMMMAMFDKAVPSLSSHIETLFVDPPKNRDIFLFDFAFEPIKNEEMIATLVSIIQERRGTQFDYVNNQGEKKTYYTFPVKIANFNGYWYLLAYDAKSDKIKSYRVNAIENLEMMQEDPIDEAHKDVLHKHLKGAVSSWIADEIKHVTLKVEGEAIAYFKRKSYDMIHLIDEEEQTDDTIYVDVAYFNDIEILRLVSKWLPYVKIVGNDALQQKMRERLAEGLKEF